MVDVCSVIDRHAALLDLGPEFAFAAWKTLLADRTTLRVDLKSRNSQPVRGLPSTRLKSKHGRWSFDVSFFHGPDDVEAD